MIFAIVLCPVASCGRKHGGVVTRRIPVAYTGPVVSPKRGVNACTCAHTEETHNEYGCMECGSCMEFVDPWNPFR